MDDLPNLKAYAKAHSERMEMAVSKAVWHLWLDAALAKN